MSYPDEYSGDVGCKAAYDALTSEANAVLVDVRTNAEWAFVGVPDLSAIGKVPLFVEWQGFPPGAPVGDFLLTLKDGLAKLELDRESPIYFLCRSGVRSKAAAIAMTGEGFANCYNVSGGFEGPLDPQNHRGTTAGWKAEGLPWRQN